MDSTRSWKTQLPMVATYSRIVVSPLLIYLLHLSPPWSTWVATGLFVLASMTDWLDGYWARKFQVESAMGKFMDPIADKILVLSALIMSLYLNQVDPVMVILLLSRDIFIGGIRSVAASNNVIIAAKPFGKWKTGIQMISIPCLFLAPSLPEFPLQNIGYYGLWVSVILSMVSGVQYTTGYYKGRKVS